MVTTRAKGRGQAAGGKGASDPLRKTRGGSRAKRRASQSPVASTSKANKSVTVNRAPVLTLWVAVVAQRQGYSWQEALTFGRVVAGWLAQSKGRRLGIFEEREADEEERGERRGREEQMGVQRLEVFGMKVPAMQVGGEWRAVSGGETVQPGSVEGGLQRAFGIRLPDAKAAMEALAAAIPTSRIGKAACALYERFRPEWRGWGVRGELSLSGIRALADAWERP